MKNSFEFFFTVEISRYYPAMCTIIFSHVKRVATGARGGRGISQSFLDCDVYSMKISNKTSNMLDDIFRAEEVSSRRRKAFVGAEKGQRRDDSSSVASRQDFVRIHKLDAHQIQFEEKLAANGATMSAGE